MNEDALISHIEELGLSNKEARVYVACLKTGPSAVQRISDQAGIKRVTTYVILESLIGLGLISQSIKGKKTYFIAEDPTNLNRLLEKREQELTEQKTNFEQILPELSALKSVPKDSPNVKFYDSSDGIRNLYDSLFTPHKSSSKVVYEITNVDQINHFFNDLGTGHPNPTRLHSGIHDVFLYTSERGAIYKDTDKESDRESRYIPFDQYPIKGNISILDDYVVILSLKGESPIGISIRSQEIADNMRVIFDLAWQQAAQFNQK